MKVGLIVSNGFDILKISKKWTHLNVETKYGVIPFNKTNVEGVEVYCTTRNGFSTSCPPHKVNYIGIINAFKKINVNCILGTSVVGSLKKSLSPGTIVILDQFLDFTKNIKTSYYSDDGFSFCDFTNPYCASSNKILESICEDEKLNYKSNGCYVGVDGPRYETAAEVKMFGILGGDVVGMTNIPEITMSREAGICYSSIAIVVNYGAGIEGIVTRKDCHDKTVEYISLLENMMLNFIKKIKNSMSNCECQMASSEFLTYK